MADGYPQEQRDAVYRVIAERRATYACTPAMLHPPVRLARGLYLAGSATHPGQWVSFCAISGVLAADRVCEDFG